MKTKSEILVSPEIYNELEYFSELNSFKDMTLKLGAMCISYVHVERVPRYIPDRRENDAEHSAMLAVIATELAHLLRPGRLDLGLIAQFSVVHDMVEIIVGDTPTFHTSEEMLEAKAALEHDALDLLLNQLPPLSRQNVARYEAQDSDEAVWVKATDKLLAEIVDIEGCGVQIMKEDYGITSTAELILCHEKLIDSFIRRFGEQCPELVPLYRDLCAEFEKRFEETISAAV
jgi:5'-deoxynucleotidase YfbR-like HD superfamily hydrolase